MSDNIEFVLKLSNKLKKANALEKLQKRLKQQFHYKLKIGVEVEFYLTPYNINQKLYQYFKPYNLKKERGYSQYEIELPPTDNLTDLSNLINSTITKIKSIVSSHGGIANFEPKPYSIDYGNSLHFHIELLDKNNINIFEKDHTVLKLTANSICHYMKETFLVFASSTIDFSRFDKNFMAPTHISFGGNNRTVAVRIPASSPLRIEHRLASPSTCPYLALYTILNSIYQGMHNSNRIKSYPKIYGNAYDPQYKLEPLPNNFTSALKHFNFNFFKH